MSFLYVESLSGNAKADDSSVFPTLRCKPKVVSLLAYLAPEIESGKILTYPSITAYAIQARDMSVFSAGKIETLSNTRSFIFITVNETSVELSVPLLNTTVAYTGRINVIVKDTFDNKEHKLTFNNDVSIKLSPFTEKFYVVFSGIMNDYIKVVEFLRGDESAHPEKIKESVRLPWLPTNLFRIEAAVKTSQSNCAIV